MTSVAIIGAGFSGLAAAVQLIAAGHDVTVYERAEDVGGVWRENTYPGAACDVPSAYARMCRVRARRRRARTRSDRDR
ncbi:FAD-dependent oxidoreductase, partial [Mycobacteroides abscessus subsp. massiliense]